MEDRDGGKRGVVGDVSARLGRRVQMVGKVIVVGLEEEDKERAG